MKLSRNEAVDCNVESYMKRRNYFDDENVRRSDYAMIKNVSDMTLSTLVEHESSHINSIIYTCINIDPVVADAQFSKLRCWINELSPVHVREELKEVLYPLLCHLYVAMLKSGHKTAALTFLKKFQSVISDDEIVLMLEELATLEKSYEIDGNSVIQKLRSSRYLLKLSPSSVEILKQYLINKSHVILLQMINSWFELEDGNTAEDIYQENEDTPNVVQTCNGYSEIQTADGDLAKLEEIIRLVKEVPASSAPLLLYSIVNPENCMTCGHVSQDTFYLAAGFNTSEVKLWSLTEKKLANHRPCSTSKVRLAIDLDEPDSEPETYKVLNGRDSITLRSHSAGIQDLAFISEHKILLSVSMDKTMRAWDMRTYSCRATYSGHNYPIWAVDVSPLGLYVATASHDKTARLWSLERSYPLRIFAGHAQDVDCLRFHPNGSYLATGSSDKSVRLWSITSGEMMRVLPGHQGAVYALSFSPDGKFLASAGDDKSIKIWDLATSNAVSELNGHSDTIISLDWSPDGEFLASCSFDNTCRIWNVKNFSSNDSILEQIPAVHNLSCNGLFSVRYSQQNTPICIAGV